MASLLFAAAAQAAAAPEKVVEPAISTLAQTIIGALLVVSWAITILALYQLIKVQNARVEDAKANNDKVTALADKMTTAFTGMQTSVENLRRSEESSQQVLGSVKTTLDLLMALRQLRPTPGVMPAVVPPERKRGGT